jgi:hypothetical protein
VKSQEEHRSCRASPRIAENRRNLTKELVSRIKPRPAKFVVWDESIPNIGLRVYPSGSKAYVLRLSFTDAKGKTSQRMETVGAAEDFKAPEAARAKGLELRRRCKAGEDVKATKRALKSLERDTEWVFPAVAESKEIVPMMRPGKAIVRHAAESGVEWAQHDLRRGFITVGESIGVPTSAVRRLTGHVVNQRDAHDGYIDFDADDLAPHLQRIAHALEGLA